MASSQENPENRALNVVDGAVDTIHSAGQFVSKNETFPWLQIDLEKRVLIQRVVVFPRGDCCQANKESIVKIMLVLSDENFYIIALLLDINEYEERRPNFKFFFLIFFFFYNFFFHNSSGQSIRTSMRNLESVAQKMAELLH